MFDPYYIGRVNPDNVTVTYVLITHSKLYNLFKAVVVIQGHNHSLLLKPQAEGYRDQVVADRLKYVCNLQPMHSFALSLNFVYVGGIRKDSEWTEYVALALNKKEVETPELLPSLKIEDLQNSKEFQIEFCKIVMFRYLIGLRNTLLENILIRNEKLLSISETMISSGYPSKEFLESLDFIPKEIWEEARNSLLFSFDLDNVKGIVLQTRQAERDIGHRRPKGPLSTSVRNMVETIEDRYIRLRETSIEKFPYNMKG